MTIRNHKNDHKNHEQGERKRMKLALGLDAHILLSVLSLPGSSPSSLGV